MSHVTDHPFPISTWADKNSHYVKRAKFLKNHNLPGINEIKLNVGAHLANIFFSTATPQLQQELGVEPLLEGPKGKLLVEPVNVLKGKVVLTEPYPRHKVQATIHQTILEIGQKMEKKFENAYKEQLEEAVKAKEKEMQKVMERQISEAILKKKTEMEEIYRIRLKSVKNNVIEDFRAYLEERDQYICQLSEDKIKESLDVLRSSMAEEMELASVRKNRNADEACLFKRISDENKKNEEFKDKIKELKKKWTVILEKVLTKADKEKEEIKDALKEQYKSDIASLEIKLNEEYNDALKNETQHYKTTICKSEKEISRLKHNLVVLKKEKECMDIQQYSWCFLVRELLKQFQKFISVTLQEKPILTEHLTSLEKLLQARVVATQDVDFIKTYLCENGSALMDEEEATKKLEEERKTLAETIEKSKMTGLKTTCMPLDDDMHLKNYDKERKQNQMMEEIGKIIDSLIRLSVPSREGSKPCIASSLLSSMGDESPGLISVATPSREFTLLGDSSFEGTSSPIGAETRVRTILEILNNHPTLKRALIRC